LTSQYQWLNSFVGLLDAALQIFIDCQAVVSIDLLLDFFCSRKGTARLVRL
jgi:hypothetical protein